MYGRQAVRKALQIRSAVPRGELSPAESIPAPITGTRLPIPPSLFTAAPTVSDDTPLPMDSDAEAAYANGSAKPHKHSHRRQSPSVHASGSSRTSNTNADTSRASALRRRWANSHLGVDDSDPIAASDYGRATPDPPPPIEPESEQQPSCQAPGSPTTAGSLLRRLRTASQTFTPFASIRRNSFLNRASWSQRDHMVEPPWSTDSSSSEEELSLGARRRRSSMDVWMDRDVDDQEMKIWPAESPQ